MSSNLKERRPTLGVFIAILFLSGGFPLWGQTAAPPSSSESSPAQTTPQETGTAANEPKSDAPSVIKATPTPPPSEKTQPKPVESPDSESKAATSSVEKAAPPDIPLDPPVKAPPPSPGEKIHKKLPARAFWQSQLSSVLLCSLLAILAVLLFILYRSKRNIEKRLKAIEGAQKTSTNMNPEGKPSELPTQEIRPSISTVPVTESLKPRKDAEQAPATAQSKPENSTPPTSQAHEPTIFVVPTIREKSTGASLAKKELERIRSEMASIFTKSSQKVASGELPLIGWGSSLPRVQKLASEHENKKWFFIGDIHGDFLALHTLLNHIQKVPDFRLAFLGDLVDRGTMSIECFALLLEAAEKYPNQILWILGNHDVALKYLPKGSYRASGGFDSRKFTSKVEPAEFVDWLNQKIEAEPKNEALTWGRLFSEICERLPVAVLFQTGLLATHGGVPLRDRWPTLKNMESFHHERSLEDFTWTRATEYPKKVGFMSEHRADSSNFEFGYKDFEGFCQAVSQFFAVKQLVRGHDHVPGGFHKHPEYKINPVLTLNGFGFNYLSNSLLEYRPNLCLGVLNPGALLEVEEIPYAPEDYEALYKNNLA